VELTDLQFTKLNYKLTVPNSKLQHWHLSAKFLSTFLFLICLLVSRSLLMIYESV
jgi:hypothetical protein